MQSKHQEPTNQDWRNGLVVKWLATVKEDPSSDPSMYVSGGSQLPIIPLQDGQRHSSNTSSACASTSTHMTYTYMHGQEHKFRLKIKLIKHCLSLNMDIFILEKHLQYILSSNAASIFSAFYFGSECKHIHNITKSKYLFNYQVIFAHFFKTSNHIATSKYLWESSFRFKKCNQDRVHRSALQL